jgi:hypothetical protein
LAGDAAVITKDTLTPDSGYLIFSLRSSDVHFDIPIPDFEFQLSAANEKLAVPRKMTLSTFSSHGARVDRFTTCERASGYAQLWLDEAPAQADAPAHCRSGRP